MTLLTASLPERADMLAEAVGSVRAQTYIPEAHLIGVDHHRRGASVIYNALARAADTMWISFLDDDDLLDPNHLETLLDNSQDADVVYTNCRAEGHTFTNYGVPYSDVLLDTHCIISITALLRRSFFEKVGGFRNESGYDWRLWQRIVMAGARVRQLTDTTWTYRYHGANQSYGELEVSYG